jgi:hypothetical protein
VYSGNITPTNPNELLVSCVAAYAPGTAGNPAPVSSPFTALDTGNAGGSGNTYITTLAYDVQTTALAANAAWSGYSSSAAWVAGIASFYSIESPTTLVATNTSLGELVAGVGGSIPLTATGGVQPYTWTLVSGTLPPPCSISGSTLSCTSSVAAGQTNGLVFKVTDHAANTAVTGSLTLAIASSAVSVTTSGCAFSGTQYVAYSGCTLVASGGFAPYTYTWNTTVTGYASIPPGLTLNPSTGAITGTNYGQGGYTTDFIATDSLGATARVDVTFNLAGNNATSLLFPTNSAFHIKVTDLPVDNSVFAQINYFGGASLEPFFGAEPYNGQPNGIPFLIVSSNQTTLPVTTTKFQAYFGNFSGSDAGPCVSPCPATAPIPWHAPIEGSSNSGLGTDMHVLIVQQPSDENPASLWEMWQGVYTGGSSPSWSDSSNALWANIGSTGPGADAMLPQDVGSADAAGLPLAPLLLNADEVIGTGTPTAPNGVVQHPIRFTLASTLGYHVWPATGQGGDSTQVTGAGTCVGGYEDKNGLLSQLDPPTSCMSPSPSLIPMGEIYRLKASVPNPVCAATSPQASVIIQGLRDYGIILADNGASVGLIGTPDSRWNDADLHCLHSLTFAQFEPVEVQQLAADVSLVESGSGTIVTSCPSGQMCYSLPVTTYRTSTSTQSATPASSPKKATPVRRKP